MFNLIHLPFRRNIKISENELQRDSPFVRILIPYFHRKCSLAVKTRNTAP